MKPLRITLLIFFLSSQAVSQESPESYAGKNEMHGFKLSDYKGFEKKWKLVTVRFRRDTGELRFTYANDLAWKNLNTGNFNYPKGAVFAKIGIATKDDPSFASSAVPSGARRYQFMVRDSEKYKDTDGWAYVLFNAEGKTFPGEPKSASLACAACHRLVPERGYVFSELMELSPFSTHQTSESDGAKNKVAFEVLNVSTLPAKIRLQLPLATKDVSNVTGPIVNNVFQGTLDEIRPTLAVEAVKASRPAVLLSKDKKLFSLVYKASERQKCSSEEIELIGVHSLAENGDRVYSVRFCRGQ